MTHILNCKTMMKNLKEADIEHVPLDIFKVAIAEQVARSVDLPLEVVFGAVDIGKKADFTLAVPRLRIKEDVKVLTNKIV